MKQTAKMTAYLVIMGLLITGTLFFSGSKDHQKCPVCNHSFASEANTSDSHYATINNNK
jgi:hypothetical protein